MIMIMIIIYSIIHDSWLHDFMTHDHDQGLWELIKHLGSVPMVGSQRMKFLKEVVAYLSYDTKKALRFMVHRTVYCLGALQGVKEEMTSFIGSSGVLKVETGDGNAVEQEAVARLKDVLALITRSLSCLRSIVSQLSTMDIDFLEQHSWVSANEADRKVLTTKWAGIWNRAVLTTGDMKNCLSARTDSEWSEVNSALQNRLNKKTSKALCQEVCAEIERVHTAHSKELELGQTVNSKVAEGDATARMVKIWPGFPLEVARFELGLAVGRGNMIDDWLIDDWLIHWFIDDSMIDDWLMIDWFNDDDDDDDDDGWWMMDDGWFMIHDWFWLMIRLMIDDDDDWMMTDDDDAWWWLMIDDDDDWWLMMIDDDDWWWWWWWWWWWCLMIRWWLMINDDWWWWLMMIDDDWWWWLMMMMMMMMMMADDWWLMTLTGLMTDDSWLDDDWPVSDCRRMTHSSLLKTQDWSWIDSY